MKTRLFVLMFLTLFASAVSLSQVIPNGGFENWSDNVLYEDPDTFISTNLQPYFQLHSGNVTKTTDNYSGTYAAKLQTVVSGSDTVFGGLFIGTPASGGVRGGLPYTDKPDSLKFYAKFIVAPKDTAFVIVAFKNNGTIFAYAGIPLVGMQINYTEYKIPVLWFNPTLTPDTMAVVITSSRLDPPQVPGSYLYIDGLEFTGGVAPFPNGDLENWTEITIEEPDNWTTINYGGHISGDYSATKTADSYDGTYAMRLETEKVIWGDTLGYITNGRITGKGSRGGMAVDNNPDKLSGYYKYTPSGTDTALALVYTYRYDAGLDSTILLEVKSAKLTGTNTYTYFEIPLLYNDCPFVDTVNISFTSGNMTNDSTFVGNLGSVLYLDALDLTYKTTGAVVDLGNDTALCADDTIILYAAGGYDAYMWSDGSTADSLIVDSAGVTLGVPVTYYVTVTEGNCQTIDSINITFKPITLSVDLAGGDDTTAICQGDSIAFDPGVSLGYTFIWKELSSTDTLSTEPTITVDTAGTYYVIVKDPCGLTDSDTITLIVNPYPVVNLGADTTLCADDTIILHAGSGYDTYQWIPGFSFADSLVIDSSNKTLGVPYFQSVMVTHNGCTSIDAINITYRVLPDADLGINKSICAGDSTTLDPGIDRDYTYIWKNTLSTDTLSIDSSITVDSAGIYYVIITDECGFMDTDTIKVTVNPLPPVNLGADKSICANDSVKLSTGLTGLYAYIWSTGSSDSTITVDSTGVGIGTATYWVHVIDLTTGCMSLFNMIDVTFKPLPDVHLGTDTALCAGDTIILHAGSGYDTYQWVPGFSFADSLVIDSSNKTLGVPYFQSVMVTHDGCTTIDAIYVTFKPLTLSIDLGADSTICEGTDIILNPGVSLGYNFVWTELSLPNDTISTSSTLTVNTGGTYVVSVDDRCGLTDTDTIIVTANPVPTADAGGFFTICCGDIAVLTATGGGNYIWSNGAITASITVAPVISTTYTVTVTNAFGCTDSDDTYVNIQPVIVDLGGDTTACANSSIMLQPAVSCDAGYTLLWSDSSTAATLTVDSTGVGIGSATYWVTVIDTVCNRLITDSVIVTFIVCSGVNDNSSELTINLYPNPTNGLLTLSINGLTTAGSTVITVFNMQGQVVYTEQLINTTSHNYTKQLDLTDYPQGVYFMKLADGNAVIMKKIVIQ